MTFPVSRYLALKIYQSYTKQSYTKQSYYVEPSSFITSIFSSSFKKWQDTALRMVSGSGPAFDIVIFGASGYTGQYVIEYVVRNVEDDFKKQQGSVQEPRKLKWAVAGRSKDKLAKVLMSASLNVPGFDHSTIELIVCDVKDESSLKKMVTQTKVLLNCVGPYRFSGEPVVKACAQYGTHYVDISGEPQFLETMQLKYNDQAAQNGTYIVGSCGFDSIPSDMGQVVVHRSMDGPVNTIETYLKADTPSDEPGAIINFATYQSAIYGYAMADELKPIRKALFPQRLPNLKPKLPKRQAVHYNPLVKSWCLPFPGSDRSVMMRTQRGRYHEENKRPAQIGSYVQFSSLFVTIMVILVGIVFGIMAKFALGRKLLEMFPGLFTLGAVSKQVCSYAFLFLVISFFKDINFVIDRVLHAEWQKIQILR